jgi:aspartyl-tRNA(Asn)/glutamyl-tRNA(Gln) amidotransferase subunit B
MLSAYDAHVLTQHRRIAELFEQTVSLYAKPKPVANWMMGMLLAYCNAKNLEPDAVRVQPVWLVHLLQALEAGTISGTMAKELFVDAIEQQQDPQALITTRNLSQIVDDGVLERLAEEVIAANQKSVQEYRNGKANALMFLVGQCMRRSQGRANPNQVTDILKRKLSGEVKEVS